MSTEVIRYRLEKRIQELEIIVEKTEYDMKVQRLKKASDTRKMRDLNKELAYYDSMLDINQRIYTAIFPIQ